MASAAVAVPAQSEFDIKNNFLASVATPVSPCEMYTDLYGDDYDNPRPYVVSTGSRRIMRSDNMDDLLDLAVCRDDIYVHPCTFFGGGSIGMRTLQRIYAIVVDLDHVSCRTLKRLAVADYCGLRPTYIVNSGNGLHLYYVLSSPAEAYDKDKPRLNAIFCAAKSLFVADGADQGTSLIQSYRVAGSQSKAGRTTTAYRLGNKWSLAKLEQVLCLSAPSAPVAAKREQEQEQEANKTRAVVVPIPTGRKGFYTHVKDRILAETPKGNRETALFALAVIGYKCRLKRDRVEADISELFDVLNNRDGHDMRETERHKPMTGYCSKYIRATSERIEEWLGFGFLRQTKRNGRDRSEHGRYRKSIAAEHQAAAKQEAIAAYLLNHPDASNREISRELGMCHKTVAKYRQSLATSTSEGVGRNIAFSSSLGGAGEDSTTDKSITTTSSSGGGRVAGHHPPAGCARLHTPYFPIESAGADIIDILLLKT